jgi:hypothetical protein
VKRLVFLVLVLLLTTGCNSPRLHLPKLVQSERPTVNLPLALRQSNWLGPQGDGSCTWATLVSLLRWQGR